MIRGIDKLSQDQAISKWQVVGLEQISGQALAFSDEAIAAEREALDMVRSSFGVEYEARVWKTPLPVGAVEVRVFVRPVGKHPDSDR